MSELRGRHLHFDCVSGIAGDMTLGALIDLGVPVTVIGDALDAIGVGRARLGVHRVVKGGFAAVDVKVDTRAPLATGPLAAAFRHGALGTLGGEGPDGSDGGADGGAAGGHAHHHGDGHPHDHARGGRAHHHWSQIRARLVAAGLGADVLARALDMFERVARAEAKLHGTSVADVAFHEVGAIDSVVDIVGTAAALAWLAPVAVTCADVAMGQGTLVCAHGVLPVPAPAALEILREARGVTSPGGLAVELTTPTGAAILAHAVTAWTAPPAGTPLAVGWGAGDVDLPDRANVVRVTALAPRAAAPTASTASTDDAGALWRLEANIDDMSPELAGHAITRALAAGAVDAWWTPITMKKGRPALLFAALAPAAVRDAVIAMLLRETTTIGVRFDRVERTVLAREVVTVDTEHGPIPIKLARGPDGAVWNAAPEHDACAAAAARTGAPLKDVYAAAVAAWHRRRADA